MQPAAANLLSGGVDSSYLQAIWNRVAADRRRAAAQFLDRVDHPRTWLDTDYAMTAAQALGAGHTLVPADDLYAGYLLRRCRRPASRPTTCRPPTSWRWRGRWRAGAPRPACAARGPTACSASAWPTRSMRPSSSAAGCRRPLLRRGGRVLAAHRPAGRLAGRLPAGQSFDTTLRDLEHPVNQVASFADWEAMRACFGGAAVAAAAAGRRTLLDRLAVPSSPQDRLHGAGFLGEAVDSASLWTTLFNHAGADLFCPFLDSRMLRFALNLPPAGALSVPPAEGTAQAGAGTPGAAPSWRGGASSASDSRSSSGWRRAASCGRWSSASAPTTSYRRRLLAQAKARPSWFLYSLLCYDLWHKMFIERSLAFRSGPGVATRPRCRPGEAIPHRASEGSGRNRSLAARVYGPIPLASAITGETFHAALPTPRPRRADPAGPVASRRRGPIALPARVRADPVSVARGDPPTCNSTGCARSSSTPTSTARSTDGVSSRPVSRRASCAASKTCARCRPWKSATSRNTGERHGRAKLAGRRPDPQSDGRFDRDADDVLS